MLDKRTLNRINDRPRGRGVARYAALAVVALALLLALVSYALGGIVLLMGAAIVFLLHRRDVAARTIRLTYTLEPGQVPEFEAAQKGCKTLSEAGRVWHVEGNPWKRAQSSSTEPLALDVCCKRTVEVGLLETPGISADVEIWGIDTGAACLFFLPECVLLYREDRYRAVSYDSLRVDFHTLRVLIDEEVPEDTEVIGETWRFMKPDGSPDFRYPNNPKSAITACGLLTLTGMHPHEIRLLVSSRAAALSFMQALGGRDTTGPPNERESSAREEEISKEPEIEVEKAGSLHKILGLTSKASREEINAAYKRKAKKYHPDVVANLSPEVRKMSELRMKELNAAYGEFKRRSRQRQASR